MSFLKQTLAGSRLVECPASPETRAGPPTLIRTQDPLARGVIEAPDGACVLRGYALDMNTNTDSIRKVALIIGAGSGMGAAAARRLAADGFHVGLLSSSGRAQALAESLGGIAVTGTNQRDEDIRSLADQALGRWGRIDALVNSAGHGPRAPILEITDEQWHTGMDVYLMNVVRAVRIVAPHMQARGQGSIVNISTAWAFEPSPMFPTSAVFRAGLAAYTKLVAESLAPSGVRINNVLPGWIDSLPATEERRQSVPMQRYGRSEEIAATVAFLVSDGAAYITGQNVKVDGGLMRGI